MRDLRPRMRRAPEPGGDGRADRVRMYAAAYDEGKRLVDDQFAELDSMRQRVAQFLAFVGSATAFLVGNGLAATNGDRTSGFYVLAVTASTVSVAAILLALSVFLGLVIAKPIGDPGATDGTIAPRSRLMRARWNLRLSPGTLVQEWIEPEIGATAESNFFKDLASHYEDMADENESLLTQTRRQYFAFLVTASSQVLLWSGLVWAFG